ncbi:hypothetical protein Pla86_31070 [Planctomycetes bacterium Pla86]|uniref:Uncharacterized protein n=1 Tax=Engelhardtia mirabilis TaxID=2528011 RepID=A0A518BM36_9BACT|nr:hypothetical protein Pla133_31080 [Planctomycetes bacterium Pla133]QDV02343.1 hypothetical protein Pla86_31070 [Planctomycetes bacterium Pla86]
MGVLLLGALMLRTFYVPLHLALEEHCGPTDHLVSHDADCAAHVGHGPTHTDDDHQEHCSEVHDADLIVQRPTSPDACVDLLAILPATLVAPPVACAGWRMAVDLRGPPAAPPRLQPETRGPPIAA